VSVSAKRGRVIVLGTFVAMLGAMGLAVAFGTEPVSLTKAWSDADSFDRESIVYVRGPRVLLGAISGAGLGAVGCALQAVLRNPLAEPYMLGVSGGAALGATLAILLGLSHVGLFGATVLPLFALLGALAATVLVYAFAKGGSGVRGASLLLAGVVVNAMAGAAITFLKSVVSAQKAQELLFWLVGFLDVPPPKLLGIVVVYTLLGVMVLARDAGRLNLMALGETSAFHLGVDVRALERRVVLGCSLVVGAITSATGLIGFVGLVVPHALRPLIGADMRRLLPASFFGGATLLVLCDLVARLSFRFLRTEPPVGAITALIGGPVFLWLLRRNVSQQA